MGVFTFTMGGEGMYSMGYNAASYPTDYVWVLVPKSVAASGAPMPGWTDPLSLQSYQQTANSNYDMCMKVCMLYGSGNHTACREQCKKQIMAQVPYGMWSQITLPNY